MFYVLIKYFFPDWLLYEQPLKRMIWVSIKGSKKNTVSYIVCLQRYKVCILNGFKCFLRNYDKSFWWVIDKKAKCLFSYDSANIF